MPGKGTRSRNRGRYSLAMSSKTCQTTLGNPRSRITAVVLRHPCATGVDGVNLVSKLLVAEVRESSLIPFSESKGRYKLMPLPELSKEYGHFAVRLHEPYVVGAEALRTNNRAACLSQVGVTPLLQRWAHHNGRVIGFCWSAPGEVVNSGARANARFASSA